MWILVIQSDYTGLVETIEMINTVLLVEYKQITDLITRANAGRWMNGPIIFNWPLRDGRLRRVSSTPPWPSITGCWNAGLFRGPCHRWTFQLAMLISNGWWFQSLDQVPTESRALLWKDKNGQRRDKGVIRWYWQLPDVFLCVKLTREGNERFLSFSFWRLFRL